MKYQPIIGFEVHLQPKTKSKMFCTCSAEYFGSQPNSHTCPTCLGLPGALPVPNKEGLEKCILLALALNCNINKTTKFDRKNYFYPDLPKGYQISQYDVPVGEKGFIEFDIDGDSRRIRITRVHMEEDTGKSMYERKKTLLDFNKSGVPLIEIVTEPDFVDVKEVDKFAKRLRQIVRYLGIGDADMEKGQMRYELNISLKRPGEKGLPDYKVEVKNIASISVLKKIIVKEIKRQSKMLDKGETPRQETRGLRNMDGDTVSQRVKEGSDDYRYFPEPDIPPIFISEEWLDDIKKDLIELPQEKKDRYIKEYDLEPDSAENIARNKARASFFEACLKSASKVEDINEYAQEIANWILGELTRLKKKNDVLYKDLRVKPEDLLELISAIKTNKITGTIAKNVLEQTFKTGKSVETIIEDKDLEVVNDKEQIEEFIDKAIEDNPKVVKSLEKNPNAIQFLVGQVMRLSKGKANPKLAEKMLKEKFL
ncbi:Asp-tRNA(Asn)/Glu-tRNA(Gln) amidotransferase subunit GatB [Candidatus Dojkabacteria bacterium]|nr:Asp-tRNA(Asn)/Glu-tRNA(Gln) amidotransferase subunit GatB [Candidatus Dojkabacteria bacterium]